MRTLKCWQVGMLAALLAFMSANNSHSAPDPKKEDERNALTGTWTLVAWETDGQNHPVLVSCVLKIDADANTYKLDLVVPLAGWSKDRGTFKIVGADKRIFRVDLEYTNTGPIGESNRIAETRHAEKGLWELVEKDKLRICSTEGKDRPDKFETKKGDGRTIQVFERKKP